MTSPPEAKRRACCISYNGYPHDPTCTRKGGRPVTTGETPPRQAGRHGKIWDDCEAQAKTDGQTMTDFVREAITRELARRRALDRPGTPQWAGPPDHPDRSGMPLYGGPPLVANPAPDVPHVHAPSGGVAVFHADGNVDAFGTVDTMRAVRDELDRRAASDAEESR